MKISELKQPYRRMAEYLVTQNCIQEAGEGIYNFYKQGSIMDLFWNSVDKGNHPPITEEIKTHFPEDFDFSGDDKPVMQMLDSETQKYIYTQLAKEGKFDDLPDTCEFSEPVELEVWDGEDNHILQKIIGKFKGRYLSKDYVDWGNAQIPTPKIDFSEFKNGDAIEIELVHNETRIGWFDYVDANHVVINVLKRKGNHVTNGGSCAGSKMLNKEKIKSITKIK